MLGSAILMVGGLLVMLYRQGHARPKGELRGKWGMRASSIESKRSAGDWLTRTWSPVVAGMGLGVVVTISMGILGHKLSGSGAYQNLSGLVGRHLAPQSMYWRQVMPTGVTWDVLVLVGSLVGAFAAAKLSGTFEWRAMPDAGQISATSDETFLRRWVLALVGSFLTEVGAGIAGGCTASLAVSGGAVLAPAAFLFVGAMFLGGIPTARMFHSKTTRRP